MGTSGAAETFFVVASTDLQRSGIMITRIREQLERVTDLKNKCTLTVTTVPVELPSGILGETLERQVQTVADCITHMILTTREQKQLRAAKGDRASN